jgi:hypothetical protein
MKIKTALIIIFSLFFVGLVGFVATYQIKKQATKNLKSIPEAVLPTLIVDNVDKDVQAQKNKEHAAALLRSMEYTPPPAEEILKINEANLASKTDIATSVVEKESTTSVPVIDEAVIAARAKAEAERRAAIKEGEDRARMLLQMMK